MPKTFSPFTKAAVAAATCTLAASLLAACAAETAPSGQSPVIEQNTDSSERIVDEQIPEVLVDVRTPEEFNAGHLQGAVNIPVETPEFAAAVRALTAGSVTVYCRSGNRSAQAAAMLEIAGTTVVDLGGFEQAQAETGLPVVN